jgi:hypothetical protein
VGGDWLKKGRCGKVIFEKKRVQMELGIHGKGEK